MSQMPHLKGILSLLRCYIRLSPRAWRGRRKARGIEFLLDLGSRYHFPFSPGVGGTCCDGTGTVAYPVNVIMFSETLAGSASLHLPARVLMQKDHESTSGAWKGRKC